MASVKARATTLMVKGLRAAFYSESMDLKEMRKGFEVLMSRFSLPSNVQMIRESIFGLRGATFLPEQVQPKCSILFLHGGAYAMGSVKTHAALAAHLAKAAQAQVFLPSYPLAPEHPFPQALNLLSDWLPLMEPFLLVSILKISIMLSSPHLANPESVIFKALDEFLEKEKIK